ETDGLYELFGRFEIEKYLEHNSYSFPKFFDPLSYLYICKTINIFDAGRNKDKLEDSFLKIEGNLHLIAFKDDMLFFPNEMEEIRDIMIKIGKKDQVTFKLVDSSSGHDSFLVEVEKFEEHIKDILKD
ncbi:MAG TPA: homoserine O-acetyltransferase, partial [Aliarcobacter cryaerophilus]|nr:homoserine O-acetyltransferase [Aliarcobacter cryaerophilus]